MPIPRVAIVGRPNAGKSSLMNMIAGAKVSIVDPTPGVTRDRVAAIVELEPPFKGGPLKPVEFVDTGGFDPAMLAAVSASLLASIALACWAPARRAGRIDPMQALRVE